MDHIPNVEPVVYEHIKVPYLRHLDASYEYEYGKGGWWDFPHRCGWENPDFFRIEFSSITSQHDGRFSSFLQTWFYFGLLVETFEAPVNVNDFLDSSGETITTRLLPEYIENWRSRMDQLSWAKKSQRVKELDRFFMDWHSNYLICHQHNETSQLLLPEIHLSIAILFDTLLAAKKFIFPMSDVQHSGFESQIVIDRLLENGWCQSDLARLQNNGVATILVFYYCSLLGRRPVLRDHAHCTGVQCFACQVDLNQYKARHVAEGCNCVPMNVDVTKLCSILEKEAVPLITLQENAMSGKLSIELSESKPDVIYVAISHVWADGLGNPAANSLPLCQLRLLQERVNSLCRNKDFVSQNGSANVPFWIDTLCVPTEEKPRKTALGLVAKTYEEAIMTLIVSLELENCSITRSREEVTTRMVLTSWWRRLWTLEEGVMSKSLAFQFGDGVVIVDEIVEGLQFSDSTFRVSSQLLNEAVQEIRLLYELKSKPPQKRIRYRSSQHCDVANYKQNC